MISDIRELQNEIRQWADTVFPERTAYGAMTKLVMHEIPEMLRNPEDPLEYADILILVLDAAALLGIDVADAVHRKMEINRKRTWKVDKSTGLMSHEST